MNTNYYIIIVLLLLLFFVTLKLLKTKKLIKTKDLEILKITRSLQIHVPKSKEQIDQQHKSDYMTKRLLEKLSFYIEKDSEIGLFIHLVTESFSSSKEPILEGLKELSKKFDEDKDDKFFTNHLKEIEKEYEESITSGRM